jgi:hypothetical protein
MTARRAGTLVLLAALAAALPAAAHHTGVYTPKDNAITENFKQVKFSVQAGKFDVALRLYDAGPLRAEMRARAAALPEGLEARTRAALAARDGAEAERGFMVFFVALARDLAREAARQLESGAQAATVGPRFLEAIWRYYNLADFVVGQRDARTSVAMRLAYDDAEALARPVSGAPDATRLRASFERIAQILSGLINTTTRSLSHGSDAPLASPVRRDS